MGLKALSNKIRNSRTIKSIFLGQCVSLLLAGTGVTSQFLAQYLDVNIPTAQSIIVYLSLFIIYGIYHFSNLREFWDVIKNKSHIYFPLAVIDVQANYLVVKAYQYTSITSVMLIDCFTIPIAVILTFIFLKARYNWRHLLGVVLCLGGIGILIYSDAVSNDSNKGGRNPLIGDILCLIGAIFYAISNVGQESSVKQWPFKEYLAMIGFFGTIIGAIQLSILERDELKTMKWNFHTISLILAFSIFLFTMYSITPRILKLSGSAMFNLSTLTSDVYAIIFGIFLFGKKLSYLYFIAFVIICGGLIIYNVKNKGVVDKYTEKSENIQEDEIEGQYDTDETNDGT